ncbi:glycosyltransferase family 1 protein [Sphingomonas sp. CGMCC 1.13654]|uniref:Glycosyltransferase family 1 protein n=1 Tax=Sphingomonas chungangi TaxID=2683589 RepID=A0A838LBV1_9SPHN|nr:glycosyltransferase family 1 protein [Sphingomonas chungangi]MVW56069.1 glycosyltransferase [Sphingomonas chungangi]
MREGANQALNRLVHHLEAEAGHVVRAYSPVTSTPAFEPAGTLVPVPSVRLPVRGEFQLALGLPAAIREDIDRFAPDLVHVATPDILCSRALTFAKRRGVPAIASQHTLFETYLDYYRLGWLKPMVETHLRRFYRRADHVLTPTETLAVAMRRLRGDERVTVWSRGVDRTIFDPTRREMAWRRAQGIADEETVVLFFGRLVLEKGVETYVEVIRTLQARGRPVRPLLVGAGPARSDFAELAGVVATGHLQDRDLARAVASADIMLTPSMTETFGNVVLEAMACGLPVVSADAPSARALIDHGSDGWLCSADDVAAYVAALEALIGSPDLRHKIGTHAERKSHAYAWSDVSAAVERVYQTVRSAQHPSLINRNQRQSAGRVTI